MENRTIPAFFYSVELIKYLTVFVILKSLKLCGERNIPLGSNLMFSKSGDIR